MTIGISRGNYAHIDIMSFQMQTKFTHLFLSAFRHETDPGRDIPVPQP